MTDTPATQAADLLGALRLLPDDVRSALLKAAVDEMAGADNKTEILQFRVTEQMSFRVKLAAAERGMTVSMWMVEAVGRALGELKTGPSGWSK